MQPHCRACAAYIADWYEQELYGYFDARTLARLKRNYLPQATDEITRMLMRYIKVYDNYVNLCGNVKTHLRFSGIEYTIHLVTTTIPIMKQTVDMLDTLMAESSAKHFSFKQNWIRQSLFEVFMDLVDVHGIHLGKVEFTDIWRQRYMAKKAAMELPAPVMIPLLGQELKTEV